MPKSKSRDPQVVVEELQLLTDEGARELERTVIVETTGDQALDPAEEVTGDADS